MKHYSNEYDDPRWKSRRAQIALRDDYQCTRCGVSVGGMLGYQCHHLYYVPGAAKWEHPDEALTTLCMECHRKATDWVYRVRMLSANLHATKAIDALLCAIEEFGLERECRTAICGAVSARKLISVDFGAESKERARQIPIDFPLAV